VGVRREKRRCYKRREEGNEDRRGYKIREENREKFNINST